MSEVEHTEWAGEMAARCQRAGIAAMDVEQIGSVLVVVPASNAELPSATDLQQLAQHLKGDGIRYVTIDCDVPRSQGDERHG